MKKGIFLLIAIILPIFSFISLATASTPTIHIYYSRYDSVYATGGIKGMLFNSSVVYYTVSSLVYNNTIIGNNQALHATYNRTTYLLTFGSLKTYSGEVKVTANTNNTISVMTTIPNLIRVIVYSAGQAQLVWAGLAEANSTINALAYINGTGIVTLQFANGTSISNVTLSIKENSSITKDITLSLMSYTASISSTSSGQISIQTQIPKRYSPLFMSVNYNGTSWNNESGYIVTVAYFNGTLTPALVWKGLGVGVNQGIMGGGKLSISEETIEFYGTNGTVLGYVHLVNVNGSGSFGFLAIHHERNVEFSEIKIVEVQGVKPVHAEFVGETYLNGNEVIITANSEGNVSSTAYVNFTHIVSVHHETAVLVLVSLNTTSKFIVVTHSNETANVTLVKPSAVINTTASISGKVYKAQEVIINTSSQYILFNVSLMINTSAVTVYKVVNGQFIQLNSSNYFVSNGKIEVFDDPSTTYYVVYNNAQVQSTSTTQTSTSSSSSVSTSTATPSPLVSPTPTSSPSSNNILYIGVGIAIVLIIVGLVLVLRRK
ncbi:hypothetical protein SJAV_01180 [Sulfurisphaera javensis]|uniref:Uncharacterized protein n=1 Tax=Sulfurisphaera javensis TaxID=2049879 RepID=A0AAT9GMQ5_9CREN